MTSVFDAASFLDSTTTQQSTRRPPLPVGDYQGVIGELKASNWQSKDGSKNGSKFDAPITIEVPPQLQAQIGATSVVLTDSIMLDVTDQGHLDYGPGKNNKLRRYREATSMNNPGEAFAPRALQGRVVKVKVKHEPYEGEMFDRVDNVSKP